ncbi:MAG: hypothetical protein EKK40_10435 [Bradyrhizobiaceae bacterium]|nr:MAG: hypothetical protein EKK40_10435 [Bradyrhizobiaceae bacterium]
MSFTDGLKPLVNKGFIKTLYNLLQTLSTGLEKQTKSINWLPKRTYAERAVPSAHKYRLNNFAACNGIVRTGP